MLPPLPKDKDHERMFLWLEMSVFSLEMFFFHTYAMMEKRRDCHDIEETAEKI